MPPADVVVYNRIMDLATVDTSFWSAAVAVGVDAYLYGLFASPLYMPEAVIAEVMAPHPAVPSRIYPRQVRLKLAMEDGRVLQRDPARPYWRFGKGEAASIGLALETGCYLLMNDLRPYREAIGIGLSVLCLPDIVAILATRNVVAARTALNWLDALRDTVGTALIDAVVDVIEGGRSAP